VRDHDDDSTEQKSRELMRVRGGGGEGERGRIGRGGMQPQAEQTEGQGGEREPRAVRVEGATAANRAEEATARWETIWERALAKPGDAATLSCVELARLSETIYGRKRARGGRQQQTKREERARRGQRQQTARKRRLLGKGPGDAATLSCAEPARARRDKLWQARSEGAAAGRKRRGGTENGPC